VRFARLFILGSWLPTLDILCEKRAALCLRVGEVAAAETCSSNTAQDWWNVD
jgi:hypothetical protein